MIILVKIDYSETLAIQDNKKIKNYWAINPSNQNRKRVINRKLIRMSNSFIIKKIYSLQSLVY